MKKHKISLLVSLFIASLAILLLSNNSIKPKHLRHVVAFNFKTEVSEEQKLKVTQEFYALKANIPEIIEFEGGVDINAKTSNKKFTHCFIVTVKDEKNLGIYGVHPKHKAFSALADPLLAEVMVVDYWAE